MARESTTDGQDGGYVQFWPAGERVKGEYHCAQCGYGIAVYRELPLCPMCGGASWEQTVWRPFARANEGSRYR